MTIRYPLACLSILVILHPCFANSGEPAAVLPIRKIVHQMDNSLSKWQMRVTDDSCEGDGCSKSTVWLDPDNKIRKIVRSGSGGPATSNESDKQYSEAYYDPAGLLIFEFLRGEHYKGQELISSHEERFYVRSKKLLAWKSGNRWVDESDPYWGQTEIAIKSDSGIAEQLNLLKKKR